MESGYLVGGEPGYEHADVACVASDELVAQ